MEKDLDLLGPLERLLGGRYRIERELGRGGFATVYQVWNTRLERAEALKVLKPGHEAEEEFSRRFTQEVHLAASLEHPSIVKVYDFGETEGVYWYSMQLVGGQTLAASLRERGAVPEAEAARIALPLLDALAYSHSRGIVHRDIKPENVILDGEGRPFLMDFGIAKSAGSLVKTQTGFLMGTPAYVAPEQAQGKPLDGRTDLYALGVTLYRIVSGRYPFEAKEPLQAVVLRLTQPPRPLAEALPDVCPAFAAIVMRALEREPARRWESAVAMREAIAGYLEGRPAETSATRVPGTEAARAGSAAEAEELPPDATVLGPAPTPAAVRPAPAARSSVTSALGTPSRRSHLLPMAAGFVVVLVALGASALFLLRTGRGSGKAPPAPRPATASAKRPAPEPTSLPPAPAPTIAPASPPARTAASPAVARSLRPPEAQQAAPRRPVTLPERLTPDPPFAGPPPAGCSGAAVTIGFAVDADGSIVTPRSFPSDVPAECDRFVLEALGRWRWRPAIDAAGEPVRSARLVVYVRLP